MKDELLRRIDQQPAIRSGDVTTVIMGGANADMVDGIDAGRVPRPNILLALDANGKFPSRSIPWPSQEAIQGMNGLTVFGPGTSHLMEDIDASQTTIPVYDNVFEANEYIWLKTTLGTEERMKVTAATRVEDGYDLTVTRAQGGTTAHSFSKGQSVISIGAVGEGYVAVDARGHVGNRPFLDVVQRITDGAATTDELIRVRLGRLDDLATDKFWNYFDPSGWGLAADNVYLRGQFAVGYPAGPEMRIRRRTLGNGQTVHGMEWLYTPSRKWWVQWFNETNKRVFWAIRKPEATGSPEKDLIRLLYRQGDAGKGEPDGVWDYYLNIDATTIIGELIAGRITVRGYLSAAVGDFGKIKTGALLLSAEDYPDANKTGFFAWNKAAAGDWGTDFPDDEDLGFEFWKDGTRQGRWNYDLGAMTWGPNDDVLLYSDGLDIIASDEIFGHTYRSIIWRQGSKTGDIVGGLFGAAQSGGFLARKRMVLYTASPDDENTELMLAFRDVDGVTFYSPFSANRLVGQLRTFINGDYIELADNFFWENDEWRVDGDFNITGRVFLPTQDAATTLEDRQLGLVAADDGTNSFNGIGWGRDDSGTPVAEVIAILDATTPKLVFRDKNGVWRYSDGTTV